LEWILAAVWANYQPTEFLNLDGDLQSLIVAAYEADSQIEAVLIDEQNRKMQREARRNRK
jgi:hypothetical protein